MRWLCRPSEWVAVWETAGDDRDRAEEHTTRPRYAAATPMVAQRLIAQRLIAQRLIAQRLIARPVKRHFQLGETNWI